MVWLTMYRDFASQATSFKDNTRKGNSGAVLGEIPATPEPDTAPASVDSNVQKRFSDLVGRIKKSPNYTVAIGRDLGIVAPVSSFVPGYGKPILTLKLLEGGFPQIGYKKGKYQSVLIEKQNRDVWDLLTISVPPRYVDRADMPPVGVTKIVSYKAIYMYKGEQVGEWSDTFTITVTGE